MPAILDSFFNESNDSVRISAVKLSKQHYSWYLVTFDGDKWETYAHQPESFVQCVMFANGKRIEVVNGNIEPTNQKAIDKAISFLANHGQNILGQAMDGVCVVEQATKMLGNGQVIPWDTTVWLPANINKLRDWMGY
jgi:hypothetical protein